MSEFPGYGSEVELNWKASKIVVASLVRQLADPYSKELVALGTDPAILSGFVYDLGHNGRGLASFPDFKIAVPPLEEKAWKNEIYVTPRYLLSQLAQAVDVYLESGDQQLSHSTREYVTKKLRGLQGLSGLVQDAKGVKLTVRGGVKGRPLEITQIEIEDAEQS